MSEKTQKIKELAVVVANNSELLKDQITYLTGSTRRNRQNAASVLAQVSKINPELLVPYVDSLVEALDNSEAQTRWECLEALVEMVSYDSRACDKAIAGAEASLFDEENGTVRLSALRFLCALGATTENRSEKVWPLLDEAIQCYHGDYEYQDMLIALLAFSEGKLSESVKKGLVERVAFDSKNSKGALQRRSQQIIENLS